jgi:hypothetical protein
MKRTLLLLALLAGALPALAQAPPTCSISGTLYRPASSGATLQPAAGAELTVERAVKDGVLISTRPEVIRANSAGVVSFVAVQGATIRLKAQVYGYETAKDVLVPSGGSCPATLESLTVIASVPSTGLALLDEGVALPTKIGEINVTGAGATVTQTAPGKATINVTGGGGGGGTPLTVREADTSPSVANVDTLEFDQGDGFVITTPAGGRSRVDLTAIPNSALATNPLARANHTGTQPASTISDFDAQVRTSRLDQMAAPTAAVSANSQKVTNLGAPAAATDAANKDYVDTGLAGKAAASHTHAQSDVTNLVSDLAAKASSSDSRFPTSGEKAALAGTDGAPSNSNRYVTNSDARLADARTPTSHTHAQADVTNLVSDLVAKVPTARTVSAGAGLTGGGDLSANRTLALDINGLTAETSIAAGDYVAIYDASAAALRKMTRADFIAGLGAGISSAYANVTDGTTTAAASGTDTFKLRAGSNKISVVVASNDPTHGDSAAFDVNEGNLTLDNLGGTLSWSKVSKSGSSLADLATRSAGDLNSGTLSDGRLSTNVFYVDGTRAGNSSATTGNAFSYDGLSLTSGAFFKGRVPASGFTGPIIRITDNAGTPADKFVVDAAGAITAGSIPYASVTGKPSTFAPSAHTHPATEIHDGSISNTEFGHLNNVSSNIQTQLDGKAASSHTHAAGDVASGQLALARGGTGADLSGTGGANQFLKQTSAGGAVTVGAITDADVPDSITISNVVKNNQGNTYSTGAQDFGAATSLKVPTGAGAAPTASGLIAYDSTANKFKGGANGSGVTFATEAFVTGQGYLTGNQTVTLSGDVSGSGATAITTAIGANKVTNAMLAQVATATFKGRTSASTGNVEDLTAAQATALLNAFDSSNKGLAPASGGGTTNFLRADGTWAAPAGGGSPGGSGTELQYRGGASTFSAVSNTSVSGGAITLGSGNNTQDTPLVLGMSSSGMSNNTDRDGHFVEWQSAYKSGASAAQNSNWRSFADADYTVTGSYWTLQSNNAGAGWNTRFRVSNSGDLEANGVAVPTISSTSTLTNKTIDAEATGNAISVPVKLWLPAAACNNTTAGPMWDLPTSGAASAACVTGTNIQKGVLDFADSGANSAQITLDVPSDWTSSSQVDVTVYWTTSATSGNCKWSVATAFTATNAAETDDPSFNTASTATTAAPGTANRVQTSTITNVTATGIGASKLMHLKITRDGTDGSDTIGATARLIGVAVTYRRTM